MLYDRARIHVTAGAGGNGSVSLRREAHVPRGGPDGGDGGHGGNVVVVCDPSRRDLAAQRFSPHHRAGRGGHGQGKQRHGARGDDEIVAMPPGTQIEGLQGERFDLTEPGQRAVVARGGRRRARQQALRHLDPADAPVRRARPSRRVGMDRAAAEAARRRRARGAPERRQVFVARTPHESRAEGGGLSVHDARAGPRDDRRRRAPARPRRHPGPDCGRRAGRRTRSRVPRPRGALSAPRPPDRGRPARPSATRSSATRPSAASSRHMAPASIGCPRSS